MFPHDHHVRVTDLELVTELIKAEDEAFYLFITLGAGAAAVPVPTRAHHHEHT